MAEGFTFGGGPLSQEKYAGDWLKWEEDGHYSRAEGKTAVGSATDKQYVSGLAMEGTMTTLIPWAGTNAIVGFLFWGIRLRVGEIVPVTLIVRDAVVDKRGLNWGTGAEAGGLTNAATNLPRILFRAGA